MSQRLCSLFSGIGGFEIGFAQAGFKTVLMSEADPLARQVLKSRFPSIPIRQDVTQMKSLPTCEILTAGWPCQDLSQAGRMDGIDGSRSGLVSEVFRLLWASERKPEFVILENVAFALHLDKGRAISYVTQEFEALGYAWAYRILDTQFFGLPQRRRRLFILASRVCDPALILFEEPTAAAKPARKASMTGFYWTEGNTGIGWSPGVLPPLKGGSGLSIPSPPAVWDTGRANFVVPGISDAERVQGFEAGWTLSDDASTASSRARWRLVGNAVSVPVAGWIARRINDGASSIELKKFVGSKGTKKPNAAAGHAKTKPVFFLFAEGPENRIECSLEDYLQSSQPLSHRAAKGFHSRYVLSTLKKNPEFLRDLTAFIS